MEVLAVAFWGTLIVTSLTTAQIVLDFVSRSNDRNGFTVQMEEMKRYSEALWTSVGK